MKSALLLFIGVLVFNFTSAQNDYNVSFMKPDLPLNLQSSFKKFFKDKPIKVETAILNTGVDTMTAYFGKVTLIDEKNELFYCGISTPNSVLSLSIGLKLSKDTLNYYKTDINLMLSYYTNDKLSATVLYSDETKTILYQWKGGEKSINNKAIMLKGKVRIGMELPLIKLQLLNGNILSNRDFLGKLVVINWWHTKCGPCIGEMPELNALVDKYANNPAVIFIAICDSPLEELNIFLGKKRFKYIQTLSNSEIAKILNEGYPQHLVIDKSGLICHYQISGGLNIGKELDEIIKKKLE